MAYYTERHGMRKPVAKTYDISIEKYALLLHHIGYFPQSPEND